MGGKFEPKEPVNLDPPKSDLISLEDLAKANGTGSHFSLQCFVHTPVPVTVELT